MHDEYWLSRGSHADPKDGRCAMEFVSYLANERHSDRPECVCLTLTPFCIAFNDGLPDDRRQLLRPYLARTIGTRGDGLAEQRAWMCMDWLIRVYAPAWLSLAKLDGVAERLRSLPPVLAEEDLERAVGDLSAARREADAAWAVARAAAGAAAWDAARDPVRATDGAAAGAAAWDAAGDPVWAAAGATAGAIARASAGAATWDAAQPTVEKLWRSAFDLLDRMLPGEVVDLMEDRHQETLMAS